MSDSLPLVGRVAARETVTARPARSGYALVSSNGQAGYAETRALGAPRLASVPPPPAASGGDVRQLAAGNIARREGFNESITTASAAASGGGFELAGSLAAVPPSVAYPSGPAGRGAGAGTEPAGAARGTHPAGGAGGHIALVSRLAVGRRRAAAGDGRGRQLLRLWSLPDGEQRAVLRPPIGPGQEGLALRRRPLPGRVAGLRGRLHRARLGPRASAST